MKNRIINEEIFRIKKLMDLEILSEGMNPTPVLKFIKSLVGNQLDNLSKWSGFFKGDKNKNILKKRVVDLTEEEAIFILNNMNFSKFASKLLNDGLISPQSEKNITDALISALQRNKKNYQEVVSNFLNDPSISQIYRRAAGLGPTDVLPDAIMNIQKEGNKLRLIKFNDYLEQNFPDLSKRVRGTKLTEEQIKLLKKQLKGKYKFGSLKRIWRTMSKTAQESFDEIQELNKGYLEGIASKDLLTMGATDAYALKIQESLNNITKKMKSDLSNNYWNQIKSDISPDLRKSLEEMTDEQRWPYLRESIPISEREDLMNVIEKQYKTWVEKYFSIVGKWLWSNLGRILRFILIGSTSKWKDMFKLIAKHGKVKGAFKIYWNLVKYKLAAPIIGNTLYALIGPPLKATSPETFNGWADTLGIEGFRYDPKEYEYGNAIINFGNVWFKEIFVNPKFVSEQDNMLKHYFELEYSDLLPYVSTVLNLIANWWINNYEKTGNPRIPTENDLPVGQDTAVQRFDTIVPANITPPTFSDTTNL